MRRREFIAGLGSTAAWPLVTRAQTSAMPVIGFLSPQSPEGTKIVVAPFQQGLKEAGYVEGRNVTVEYRYADNRPEHLRMQAANLAQRKVAVIVAHANTAAVVAKAATATIPVVFNVGGDPVAMGLVTSLNRPGANVTGYASLQTQLIAKQLEMLRKLAPHAASIGFLVDRTNPNTESDTAEMAEAARAVGQRVLVHTIGERDDLEKSFPTLSLQKVSAVVVGNGTIFTSLHERLIELAANHALPAIYPLREYALAGGLMSYGSSLSHAFRQIGGIVRQILQGASPADLPVQQTTKIELIINLKTAKALNLAIPETLLATADEVIE